MAGWACFSVRTGSGLRVSLTVVVSGDGTAGA